MAPKMGGAVLAPPATSLPPPGEKDRGPKDGRGCVGPSCHLSSLQVRRTVLAPVPAFQLQRLLLLRQPLCAPLPTPRSIAPVLQWCGSGDNACPELQLGVSGDKACPVSRRCATGDNACPVLQWCASGDNACPVLQRCVSGGNACPVLQQCVSGDHICPVFQQCVSGDITCPVLQWCQVITPVLCCSDVPCDNTCPVLQRCVR